MKIKHHLAYLGIGFIFGVLLFGGVWVCSAGGHGTVVPYNLLFPYCYLIEAAEFTYLCINLTQYSVYGLLLSFINKPIYKVYVSGMLLVLHVLIYFIFIKDAA